MSRLVSMHSHGANHGNLKTVSNRSPNYLQGRIFRSQRVPRPSRVGAPFLHWSELRLGVDVDLFGTKVSTFTGNSRMWF